VAANECKWCGDDLSDAIRDGVLSQHRCDPKVVRSRACVEAREACMDVADEWAKNSRGTRATVAQECAERVDALKYKEPKGR